LAALVVRDDGGNVLASSDATDRQRPIPETVLEPDRLIPAVLDARSRGFPESGGRIALVTSKRTMGWLDVWGDGRSASDEARRSLSDIAALGAVVLACRGRGEP
jgi:hypothetical protein